MSLHARLRAADTRIERPAPAVTDRLHRLDNEAAEQQ